MNPKISICVPVYNVEKYIEKCAESLFNQSLQDLEYIFVDDCSPDNSLNVLVQTVNRHPNLNIQIIRLSENVGPAIARRRAAELASGEFLYFPDSDDWIDPTMLEEMYSLAKDKDADLIKCRQIIESKKVSMKSKHSYPLDNEKWLDAVIKRETSIGLCSYIINHKLYLKAIEGMNEERMVRFEDYLLTVRLHYYSKKCILLDKYMYHINRYNEGSITKIVTEDTVKSCLRAADMLESFLSDIKYKNYNPENILKLRETGYDRYLFYDKLYCPDKWRYCYFKYGMTRHSVYHPYTIVRKLTINNHDKIALIILVLGWTLKKLLWRIKG